MDAVGSTTQNWLARATSAVDAVSSIRPGDRVFVGTACATPRALVDALEQLAKPPAGVVVTHFLTDRVGSGGTGTESSTSTGTSGACARRLGSSTCRSRSPTCRRS
jgi:hypothetical protein